MPLPTEISSWLNSSEIQAIPSQIVTKINKILNEYHLSVVDLQGDISLKTSFYEKTIEDLKENLRNENQKYLELEMSNIKYKTMINEYSIARPVASRAGKSHGIYSKVLKRKINILTEKSKENRLKEDSLNAQINFLTENYDKDSKELCTIVGEYLTEISILKKQLESNAHESLNRIQEELQVLRVNEKEYQNHIYSKTREVYNLYSEINNLKARNSILEQYKIKYKNLYEEFIKISGELNESRSNQYGMKRSIFETIEELKNETKRTQDMLTTTKSEDDANAVINVVKDKIRVIKHVLNTLQSNKMELEGLFNNLAWAYKQQNQIILDQNFNKEDEQAELLKMENASLKERIRSIQVPGELIAENENLLKQNKSLLLDIKEISDENLSLKNAQRNEEAKVNEGYVKDLEDQLEQYKSDVKTIESRFMEYKQLYESFNIEENKKRVSCMKENINKKNVLIGKMGDLIAKYRSIVFKAD